MRRRRSLAHRLDWVRDYIYNVSVQQLANENDDGSLARDCAVRLLEITPLLMRRIRSEMLQRTMPGLSIPQFRTLGYLRHHPCASLSDVAVYLGLTAPTASKLVQKLVVQKVVTRRVAEDRRRVCLSLTEHGAAALKKARIGTHQHFSRNLQSLSEEEISTVSAALGILERAFSQGGGDVNLS